MVPWTMAQHRAHVQSGLPVPTAACARLQAEPVCPPLPCAHPCQADPGMRMQRPGNSCAGYRRGAGRRGSWGGADGGEEGEEGGVGRLDGGGVPRLVDGGGGIDGRVAGRGLGLLPSPVARRSRSCVKKG